MKHLIEKSGFQIFLFCMGLLLFNWPLIGAAAESGAVCFFIWLFTVWILMIAFLFIISRHIR